MKVKASELFVIFKKEGLLEEMVGEDCLLERISPADQCGPGDLVFAEREEFLSSILQRKPSAVVCPPNLGEELKQSAGNSLTLLFSKKMALAHALIRQRYGDRNLKKSEWGVVHPSAIIHDTARIHEGCLIGPGVVIGQNVEIAEGCVIMANTVIEEGVRIGKNSILHPQVVVGYDSLIGEDVVIKSGSVIGSEGFGFAQDEKGRSYRIPQTGRVVIEDSVVVGANNCIDRATYKETRIGRGTKLDNLCHIAHNVKIGEDCLLTAGFIVAGSTEIGNRVIASGQTGVLDHLKVVDNTILVHRAGVTENVTEPGIYAGLPLQPLKEYLRNTVVAKNLNDLRRRLIQLEKLMGGEKGAGKERKS